MPVTRVQVDKNTKNTSNLDAVRNTANILVYKVAIDSRRELTFISPTVSKSKIPSH
jgi:hypothetical protein